MLAERGKTKCSDGSKTSEGTKIQMKIKKNKYTQGVTRLSQCGQLELVRV